MEPDLEELACEVGEAAGFKTLYRDEYASQVRRATLLVGSSEAANDIVQDTFVRLYQRWNSVVEPGPYLNRSVLNGCRDYGRRKQRDRALVHKLPSTLESEESNEILWDVLQELPFNHRAAVVLRYYGGMTEREIAEHLNCRPSSVGPWIRRGLDKMRKVLQ